MKDKSFHYLVFLMGLLYAFLYGCIKKEPIKVAPTVAIVTVSRITSNSAISGGNVTSDGGSPVIAKGVCWGTSKAPTTSDNKSTNGTGVGGFTSLINGLNPGTTYYIMAYATNEIGTAYSDQSTFTTVALAPVLTTAGLTAITSTTATSGGNITTDGGSTVIARGICWSTEQNPTINNSYTTDGTGAGTFTSNLTGLIPCTTYFVRAYATNSIGITYGNQLTLATTAVMATLTTTTVSSIASTTATSGGNITKDGGSEVTARGVCWATSQNPTTANPLTIDGKGAGAFTSHLIGLTRATTYYIRAYSTNGIGTSYGNQVTFTTLAEMPIVSTTEVSAITNTTVTSGGSVTSNGGATVTAKGVCWATSTNPTIYDNKTTDGTGDGTFTSNITGFTSGIIYYLRAYATNSAGTGYGNEITFKTNINSSTINFNSALTYGTVTDIDGNVYKTITIGTQTWMAENLKTTKYRNGDPIPNVTDGVAWEGLVIGAYCWYANDAATYKAVYGALYNWYAVADSRILAPTGWHMPIDTEWATLIDFLGGGSIAGGKMKEEGMAHWLAPNTGATNESGFTALPGGSRGFSGAFSAINYGGCWWSWFSPEYQATTAGTRYISSDYSGAYIGGSGKFIGFSVRCIKDAPIPTLITSDAYSVSTTTATSGGNIISDGGSVVTVRGVCWGTAPNPTIANSKTTDGTGVGTFASNPTGLAENTTYYLRSYATNRIGTGYGNEITFKTNTKVSDIDGNVYNTVTIGTQTWMVENLRTTKYRNGVAISNVTDNISWDALADGAYCWYNNDASTYKAVYGALYNWYAVADYRNIAPIGWHVPTDVEWTTLTDYLGGLSLAGGKLKATGMANWLAPNTGATNTSGFTAFPGGYRFGYGTFSGIGYSGRWWASTDPNAWNWDTDHNYDIDYNYSVVFRQGGKGSKQFGFSVRCVKD